METSKRSDQELSHDINPRERFMNSWMRRGEGSHSEIEPQHHTLSGERWQTIFRNLYQRTDASPERDEHTERQYELRHEHKDISATDTLHLGAVVAASLGDPLTETNDFSQQPSVSKPTNPPASPSVNNGQLPTYTPASNMTTKLVIGVLVILIVGLLYILIR